jgi:hypothetical protein
MIIFRAAKLASQLARLIFRRLHPSFRNALVGSIGLAAVATQAMGVTILPAPGGLDVDGKEYALLSNNSSGWSVSSNGGALSR